jgi:hypothetical protein
MSLDDKLAGNEQQPDLFSPPPVACIGESQILSASRARSLLAVLLVLAAPFLVDAPVLAVLDAQRGDSFLTPVLLSIIAAKFGLMTMWSAWGGSWAFLRMLVVALSWCFTSQLIPVPPSDKFEIFAAVVLGTLLCGAVVALPRLFGVRWVTQRDLLGNRAAPSQRMYQFSILDMFTWTTTTAVMAALVRWSGLPNYIDVYSIIVFCIAAAILIVGVWAAMWAGLTMRKFVGARVVATLALALLMGLGTAVLSGGRSEDVGYTIAWFLCTEGCLLAACFIMRRNGHRLVRISKANMLQEASASTTPAPERLA